MNCSFINNSPSTGSSIHERVTFILESWNLPKSQQHMILSDTAANMKKAFENEEWGGCFQHILALSVKHSIFEQSGVKRSLKKMKTVVKKMRTPSGIKN